jgi:hypothetical protein
MGIKRATQNFELIKCLPFLPVLLFQEIGNISKDDRASRSPAHLTGFENGMPFGLRDFADDGRIHYKERSRHREFVQYHQKPGCLHVNAARHGLLGLVKLLRSQLRDGMGTYLAEAAVGVLIHHGGLLQCNNSVTNLAGSQMVTAVLPVRRLPRLTSLSGSHVSRLHARLLRLRRLYPEVTSGTHVPSCLYCTSRRSVVRKSRRARKFQGEGKKQVPPLRVSKGR